MDDFIVIAITRPDFFTEEAERINLLFAEKKFRYLHLRKPGASSIDIEKLLTQIDPEFHPLIKLHDHFQLINSYNLGGIHLNSRNPVPPFGVRSVSKSIHSVEYLKDTERLEYVFLSPIFDSISKPGYKAAFVLEEIANKIKGKKVVALGGVTPDKFHQLKSLGFHGAALLGHFFPKP